MAERRQERRERLRAALSAGMEGQFQIDDEELLERIDEAIRAECGTEYLPLGQRVRLRRELYDSFRRLDILQELVDDPEVTEIMVNGTDRIFVEKQGKLIRWDRSFSSTEQLEDLIQQVVSRVNRTVNFAQPIADARLEDGSRVHVVLPPAALDGPTLTIRKFPEAFDMERLIFGGSITEEAADFLEKLVKAGYNIFVSGGTGSGKTTFLNALSGFIPAGERIITIEDSAERSPGSRRDDSIYRKTQGVRCPVHRCRRRGDAASGPGRAPGMGGARWGSSAAGHPVPLLCG